MQIQAIHSFSFKGAETPNGGKTAVNKQQKTKQDNFFTLLSKDIVYETKRMSEGREEKDGKYKLAEIGTSAASIGALAVSLVKDVKVIRLDKKAKKLIKQSASSDKISEMKAAAKQKFKGAKGAFIVGAVLFVASRVIRAANIFDAKKTVKERGFMTDDELELKLLASKVEKQNSQNKIEKPENEAEIKTEETGIEETKEPV